MSGTSVFNKTSRYRNFKLFPGRSVTPASGWRGALKDLATQHEVPLILGAASGATIGAGAYAHHRDPESKLGRNLGVAGGLGLVAAGGMGLGGLRKARDLARESVGLRASELARYDRADGRRGGFSYQKYLTDPWHWSGPRWAKNIKGFGGRRPLSRYQTFKKNNEYMGGDIIDVLSPIGYSLRSYGNLMKHNWGIPLAAAGAATAGGGMVADHMGYEGAGNIAKGVGGLAAAIGAGYTAGAGLKSARGHTRVRGTVERALERQTLLGISEGVHMGKIKNYYPRAPLMRKPPSK